MIDYALFLFNNHKRMMRSHLSKQASKDEKAAQFQFITMIFLNKEIENGDRWLCKTEKTQGILIDGLR